MCLLKVPYTLWYQDASSILIMHGTRRDTMVTELLKHGADVSVETSDTRQTPLQLCQKGHPCHDKRFRVTVGGIPASWIVFTKLSSKKQFDATIKILSDL